MIAAVQLTTQQIQNFKAKVSVREGLCWLWNGARDYHGYGQVMLSSYGVQLAHRIAYILENGEIPEGLWVLHTCDVPACVNPSHLYVGTPTNNAQDRENRNRRIAPTGSLNGNAAFTEEQILKIRAIHSSTSKFKPTLQRIANEYSVSLGAIKKIVYKERWSHV